MSKRFRFVKHAMLFRVFQIKKITEYAAYAAYTLKQHKKQVENWSKREMVIFWKALTEI
jgi:hypothetical protein